MRFSKMNLYVVDQYWNQNFMMIILMMKQTDFT